jgi:hypothetical protein
MNTRMKVPQMAGVRRSVEVRHGTTGIKKMLRRGLHGSKNWVLEPEENGEHRSVWSKAFRVFVVTIPVWIVTSAFTGGPERGGHSVSVFQSFMGAVLVCVIGLAVFSARERRLGREEPWRDFEDEEVTEGEDSEAETQEVAASEEETKVLENVQVSESGPVEVGEISEDDSENSVETARIEQADLREEVQQAIRQEPETVVIPGSELPERPTHEPMHQATTEGAKPEESEDHFDTIASVVDEFRREDLRPATPEPPYSLVKDDVEPLTDGLQEATSDWSDVDVSDVTEGDDGAILDEPTTPLRAAVRTGLHEQPDAIESPQVSLTKEPVQQPLQGVLQVQFATPGPYPAGDEPVHENWWVVAPDIEPVQEGEEAVPEPVQEDAAPEVPQILQEAVEAEQEAPQVPVGRHPMVVLTYHASQAPKSGFTPEEKTEARSAVIAWLREEVEQGHLTRAEGARILGVDGSTVTRWLSDDPWAG